MASRFTSWQLSIPRAKWLPLAQWAWRADNHWVSSPFNLTFTSASGPPPHSLLLSASVTVTPQTLLARWVGSAAHAVGGRGLIHCTPQGLKEPS